MRRSLQVPQVGHKAPIPLGARVGPLICSSGIAGKDPVDGTLPADGATQVVHAFTNLQALLAAGGAGLQHVVKLDITLADDAAAVLDAAGVQAAHVMGFSMGGHISQEFCLRHPARVLSLGLHHTWARN